MDTFLNIYDFIRNIFTTELVNVLATSVSKSIEQIAPIFLIGFSIYVLLLGFNWLREGIDENLVGTAKSMIGWLLLIALAFNASNYMMIATALYELPDKLGFVVAGLDLSDSSGFKPLLDVAFLIMNEFEKIADDLAWYHITHSVYVGISGLIIAVCSFALFFLVFAFYLIAKISLLLILFLGPIFIGFMLYPTTRQYGMNWIGQVLNFNFTIVLYIVVHSLIIQIAGFVFGEIYGFIGANGTALAAIISATIVFVVCVLLFFVVFNIPGIASALTGGASVSASGGLRFLMGAKGALAMKALKRAGGSMSKR